MTNKIEQARLLAIFVHFNQKRQDGEDYINHCERVVESIKQSEWIHQYHNDMVENIICAAWLHDVVEDGKASITMELIGDYFGDGVYTIVNALTHHSQYTYNEYITRVFQHPVAWKIKWGDMIDNTSYNVPDKQRIKYKDACIHLTAHGVEVPAILRERLGI